MAQKQTEAQGPNNEINNKIAVKEEKKGVREKDEGKKKNRDSPRSAIAVNDPQQIAAYFVSLCLST